MKEFEMDKVKEFWKKILPSYEHHLLDNITINTLSDREILNFVRACNKNVGVEVGCQLAKIANCFKDKSLLVEVIDSFKTSFYTLDQFFRIGEIVKDKYLLIDILNISKKYGCFSREFIYNIANEAQKTRDKNKIVILNNIFKCKNVVNAISSTTMMYFSPLNREVAYQLIRFGCETQNRDLLVEASNTLGSEDVVKSITENVDFYECCAEKEINKILYSFRKRSS
ncbi:MAG: hypothetical protein QW412_01305 [Candidatus Aenigmatarchaeota archaeon]